MAYTKEQEKQILGWNPFDGDMDSNFSYLKNKIGKVRKECECRNCLSVIKAGEAARLISVVFKDDGEILHGKYCGKCCDALAKDYSGELFSDRFQDRKTRPANGT